MLLLISSSLDRKRRKTIHICYKMSLAGITQAIRKGHCRAKSTMTRFCEIDGRELFSVYITENILYILQREKKRLTQCG